MLKSLDMLILPALNESHPVKYYYNINVTIIREEEPGASKKERKISLSFGFLGWYQVPS
jgi:hypothetical protein